MKKGEKKSGSYERFVQILRRNGQKIKLNEKDYTQADIYDNSNLKKLLVDEHPDLAHRLYLQWEDEELGKIFANTYNNHPDYGEQAAHIASELGILGIKVPFSQVRKDVEDFEEKIWDIIPKLKQE